MKRLFFISAMLFGLTQSGIAVQTPIYPVLSDSGIAGDDIYIWGPAGSNSVTLSNSAVTAQIPEGVHVFKGSTIYGGASTWAVMFLGPPVAPPFTRAVRPVDLSAYAAAGEIRFWVNCDNANFKTFIQYPPDASYPTGYQWTWDWSQTNLSSYLNQWVSLVVPLNSVPAYQSATPLSNIVVPFGISMNSAGTCYVDNVRYVNPPSQGAAIFNVAVKDIASQSPTGSFAWNNVASNGWVKANQYIELQLDDAEDLNWGVQIYTNNTIGANSYTGAAGTNPAGLVNTASRSMTIPLAWSVKPSTNTPAAAAPTAADPTNASDKNSFQWIFMKDAKTPTIPSQNTTAFIPGEAPVTVKNNVGIHFGQANTEIGAADAPNYIYLEANIGAGLTNSTYQTTTLTIEYYTY